MKTCLHKLVRTTPAVRAEIALSGDCVAVLACRHGVSGATARKWKARSSPHDHHHIAHKLQTTLSPAQKFVAVELRRTLLLPLDDLLAITRYFMPGCLTLGAGQVLEKAWRG